MTSVEAQENGLNPGVYNGLVLGKDGRTRRTQITVRPTGEVFMDNPETDIDPETGAYIPGDSIVPFWSFDGKDARAAIEELRRTDPSLSPLSGIPPNGNGHHSG